MTKKFVSYKEYIMLKESLIGAPLTLGMSKKSTIGEMGMDMGMGSSGGPDMGGMGGGIGGMGMPSMNMKKKKKPPMPMDDLGDEDMDIEDDEEITDDEGDEDIEDDEDITDDEGDEDIEDDEDMGMDMNFKKKKKPMLGMKPPMMTPPMGENCDHEEPDGDEEDGEEEDIEMSFQKKKQKKQKKCSKCSKMNKESNEFFNSIKRMTGGNKFAIDEFGNWVPMKEDALIAPTDINQNVTEPNAGEVGYAPQTRVGGLPSFTEWTKRK